MRAPVMTEPVSEPLCFGELSSLSTYFPLHDLDGICETCSVVRYPEKGVGCVRVCSNARALVAGKV